jgi:hypothetical protein
VEPVVSDPLDELAADPDVISGGGEDFSAFVVSRWPGLVRLAFGLTGDRWAAEDIAQATLARAYLAWRRVSRADDPDAYLRRILVNTDPGRPTVYPLPLISIAPPGVAGPQTDGLWNHVRETGTEPTRALLASGTAWSIELIFGVAGDCYEFTSPGSPGDPETSVCGPISTPEGPETIMTMPLSYPPTGLKAPTGYAVQVSPGTGRLRATASDGSTQLVTPRVVAGRRYAAFVIGTSLRLERLTWLDTAGKAFASTTSLPRSGYTQFQP